MTDQLCSPLLLLHGSGQKVVRRKVEARLSSTLGSVLLGAKEVELFER